MEKFKKNCEKVYNSIGEFIDYKLTIEEAYEFIQHCDTCKECMEELKEEILIRSLIAEEIEDNIESQISEEISLRIDDVNRKYYFYEVLQRNMKYFVVGSGIFIILSYIMDLIF